MYDTNNLLNIIKKASTEAVDATKPTQITFGKVISVNPLKIQVEQKLILSEQQLVLSQNVTNHEVSIIINTQTNSTSLSCELDLTHKHDIKQTTTIKINNALKPNDEIILFRMQGGQKYIVIDRIGG